LSFCVVVTVSAFEGVLIPEARASRLSLAGAVVWSAARNRGREERFSFSSAAAEVDSGGVPKQTYIDVVSIIDQAATHMLICL
jgi:hypothetical protein